MAFPKPTGKNAKRIISMRITLLKSDSCDVSDAPEEETPEESDFARDSRDKGTSFPQAPATHRDVGSDASKGATRNATLCVDTPGGSDAKNSNKIKPCVNSVDSVAEKHLHSQDLWREEI